ncbi:MAG: NUDIX domain-containing protein [Caldilineaceae bacterium]
MRWRTIPEGVRWYIQWALNPKVVVGVSGILLNERDEVLLLKHRFHPENPWGFPAGGSTVESVDQAWLREVKEETGLDAVVEGLVMQENSLLTLEFILWGRVTGGALALDGLEILDAQYFAADNLPAGSHEDHSSRGPMVFARRTVGMPRIKNRVMRDS